MPKTKTKLTLRRTDEWKKNLVRGDVIAVAVPNDFDQRGKQKYRPAIVLENKFNSKLPVQTVNVQTLSGLSNWSTENRKNSIEESFFWNNRQQYIQQVGFTEISYGLIKDYYGRKKQTFTDSAVAMQLIKKNYKIDNNWSNLEPTGALLTAYERQQMTAFKTKLEAEFEQQKDYEMKQLTSENLKKEEKYKLEKRKNSKLQDEINKLRQENQQSQQIIVQQKKEIVEQEEQLTEWSQKDHESQQIIANQQQQLFELNEKYYQLQDFFANQQQLTELLQQDYKSKQMINNQQIEIMQLRKNIDNYLNAQSKNFDLDEVNACQYDEKIQSDFVSNASTSANY